MVIVDLITEIVTQLLDVCSGRAYTVGMMEGTSHILGKIELSGVRFHHIAQNRVQFKTYKLFLFATFSLTFLNYSLLGYCG